MTDTTHLALPLIAAAQAQKHVTHNEALRSLDALVMLSVDDRDLSTPPGSPTEGARYLVQATGTGAFAGKDGMIAHFRDGAFAFHTPRKGWIAYVADEDALILFDGSAWRSLLGAASEFQDVTLFGLGTIADAANPLSARLNNALFVAKNVAAGGDGDLRWKLSKESAGNTASLLFQDNFFGRAEIGLAGDDDLHLKVSSDGTTWREGLVIAAATGKVSFPQGAIGLREKLAANRTYYVRTDGNDSNSGLADNSGGAFLTIAAAMAAAAALDASTYNVTIQVRSGTRTATVSLPSMLGSGTFTLVGDTGTPGNCVQSVTGADAISGTDAGNWVVKGFKLQTTTSGNGLVATGRTKITFESMDFGIVAGAHQIFAYAGGQIVCAGNYTISGQSAYAHMTANGSGAYINAGFSRTVTIAANVTFSIFAFSTVCSAIESGSNTYSLGGHTVTATRYTASMNATINSYGGGAGYFPGSAAGSTATGGQYA
jgi:hypothetical protein